MSCHVFHEWVKLYIGLEVHGRNVEKADLLHLRFLPLHVSQHVYDSSCISLDHDASNLNFLMIDVDRMRKGEQK
jgi:hypothetical protein